MEYMKQIIDYGVIGILLLMSVVSIGLAIERWLTYRALQLDDYTDKRELEIHLTSKLHLIATIASNAPYIGLLGTVLGIMATFYSMGLDGFMDTNKIMVGLALALKATAIGLLVAIPSVAFYNMLLRRVKVLLTQWDIRHDALPHA
ncbi:MAG: TonB-system energizer ExbB [Lentisphaeria bacterium]